MQSRPGRGISRGDGAVGWMEDWRVTGSEDVSLEWIASLFPETGDVLSAGALDDGPSKTMRRVEEAGVDVEEALLKSLLLESEEEDQQQQY